MPATKRGVYHNLRESTYVASNNEVTFFFSSRLYLNKFLGGYEDHREKFLARFAKIVVDNPLNMATVADINYYLSIEKRGFYVWLNKMEISLDDLYRYALRKMTETHKPVWYEINRPNAGERIRIF